MLRFLITLLYLTLCLVVSVKAETVTVVTEFFPPYQTLDENEKLGGCSTEVVQKLFELTGDNPEIIVMPWSRAYVTALQTPNVMIFSISHNTIRHDLFYWLGELAPEKVYFWGLKSKFSENIKSEQDLRKYSIATSKNSNPHQYMEQHNFPQIYPVTKLEQGIQMVMLGRVDLITGSTFSLSQRSKKLGLDFSKLTKAYLLENLHYPLSIAFNKASDKSLLAKYQQAFDLLKQQGVIKTIMAPCIAAMSGAPAPETIK